MSGHKLSARRSKSTRILFFRQIRPFPLNVSKKIKILIRVKRFLSLQMFQRNGELQKTKCINMKGVIADLHVQRSRIPPICFLWLGILSLSVNSYIKKTAHTNFQTRSVKSLASLNFNFDRDIPTSYRCSQIQRNLSFYRRCSQTISKVFNAIQERNHLVSLVHRYLGEKPPEPYICRGGKCSVARCDETYFSCGWVEVSGKWKDEAKKWNTPIFRKEAGGGGDCLFHSIALGLRYTDIRNTDGEFFDVRSLRRLVAAGFVGRKKNLNSGKDFDENVFLSKLAALSAIEASGTWYDKWSPSKILNDQFYLSSKGMLMDVSEPYKKANAVYFELSQCGNVHWGTDYDIGFIEDALNIKIILLSDSRGNIYSRGESGENPSRPLYYMLLYYLDDIHFQLAGIRMQEHLTDNTTNPSTNEGMLSYSIMPVFRPENVPNMIRFRHCMDCKCTLA